ncbi:MAG: hypothetical protein AAF908_05200 [Pseudomonadota bacterium]
MTWKPEGWFESFFDPFAPGEGPPPRTLGRFMRWVMRGSEPAVYALGLVSLLLGIAEASSAWLVGWLVDKATEVTPPEFFAAYWLETSLVIAFFLGVRPVLMVLSSGLVSRSLSPGLFNLSLWRLHRHTLGQSLSFFEDDFAGRISAKEIQTSHELTSAVTEFLNAVAYGLAAVLGAAAGRRCRE